MNCRHSRKLAIQPAWHTVRVHYPKLRSGPWMCFSNFVIINKIKSSLMLQKQKLKCLSCFTGIFSLSIETIFLWLCMLATPWWHYNILSFWSLPVSHQSSSQLHEKTVDFMLDPSKLAHSLPHTVTHWAFLKTCHSFGIKCTNLGYSITLL